MVNETIHTFYIGFHSHIWRGCGSEYIKNHSNGLEVFIHNQVADSGKIFRLNNEVPIRADMKYTADSLQTFVIPLQKLRFSNGARYLNLSEKFSYFQDFSSQLFARISKSSLATLRIVWALEPFLGMAIKPVFCHGALGY